MCSELFQAHEPVVENGHEADSPIRSLEQQLQKSRTVFPPPL